MAPIVLVALLAVLLAGCSLFRRTEVVSANVGVNPDKYYSSTSKQKAGGWYGKTYHHGNAWVTPLNRPYAVPKGLDGNHLSLWASHGRYYKIDNRRWEWQRVNLFGTNEDLFTQTFVVPYLIPMLQNAGAVVFTPRERDWQTHEVVVDNDTRGCYREIGKWKTTATPGFSMPKGGVLHDGDTPFATGTVRMAQTTRSNPTAYAEYTPSLPVEGDYAVYVSYQTVSGSTDEAHYTIYHGGQQTEVSVNQQMGGGTWVYIGTYHFTTGDNLLNGVVLDNHSRRGGKVTTDAVRFGGGMGNVVRGGSVSGMPRANEGARYYCQWAGAPYGVYSQRAGKDDYADDINVRSMMTNWLAGGSCYEPDTVGLGVPIELSLALHSDAGFNKDFKSIYGSLGIVTTDFNNHLLASGQSRSRSREFVDMLLSSVSGDMKKTFGTWNVRDVYDRNYSETRRPEVPSAILEMLSHQSFPDMRLAHDPYFKFVMSRAVYKAVLKYVAGAHGKKYVVSPLVPLNFRSQFMPDGMLTLSWESQSDPLEPTAAPTGYVLYIARDGSDFDNGRVVKSTSVGIRLEPGKVYRFRVSAINDGGESFRSEELAAVYRPGAPVVLVANAFHRLAGPQVIVQDTVSDANVVSRHLAFDLLADPGVSYGKTPAWIGNQQVSNTALATGEGPGTFGYSGNEMGGAYVAGNDFNYATTHVRAIAEAGVYSAVSCDSRALPLYPTLTTYPVIDLILGNERNDGYSLRRDDALSSMLRSVLSQYNGGLMVSGSYIASDSRTADQQAFLAKRLSVEFAGQNRDHTSQLHGMGKVFDVHRTVCEEHYASTASDVLAPVNGAFSVLAYADGSTAAVANANSTFVMGFPFECVKQESDRNWIMAAVLAYLCQ